MNRGRFQFANVERERYGRSQRYRADLLLDGEQVGCVERGWSQGGYRSDEYVARVERVAVASGRTLDDLRAELRDPSVVAEVETLRFPYVSEEVRDGII